MKESRNKPKSDTPWQKTQYSNLIRYVPSGTYFARVRVHGKLIRKTLKTDVLSVAKLRLGDQEKTLREQSNTQAALDSGKMSFGDLLVAYQTAKFITWADVDFTRGKIAVRGHPMTGTKNREVRDVPLIPDMRALLERLRSERPDEPLETPVMQIQPAKSTHVTMRKTHTK
jgi:hypothetical protein